MGTKKIRIAVAINDLGDWCAAGWHSTSATPTLDELAGMASEGIDVAACEALVWIEADIPIPSPLVVQGKTSDLEA